MNKLKYMTYKCCTIFARKFNVGQWRLNIYPKWFGVVLVIHYIAHTISCELWWRAAFLDSCYQTRNSLVIWTSKQVWKLMREIFYIVRSWIHDYMFLLFMFQIQMYRPISSSEWARTRAQTRWHRLRVQEKGRSLVQRNATTDWQNWTVSSKLCGKNLISF